MTRLSGGAATGLVLTMSPVVKSRVRWCIWLVLRGLVRGGWVGDADRDEYVDAVQHQQASFLFASLAVCVPSLVFQPSPAQVV